MAVTLPLLAVTLLLALQPAVAATTARVDRTTVSISDSFQITFETDQSVSDQPDFAALAADFEILSTSKSTSINIQNGSMQRATRWILEVLPKREGKLVIPPVTIGNESSNAINMTVAAQGPGAGSVAPSEIDLEIDIDNLEPYVQSQIIFTVRLVHAVSISDGNLSEPAVTTGDALIQKLGDDVTYETSRGADRVGIIERRYAIFPQNSARITIGPVRFEGRVLTSRQFGFDPFARGRIVRKQTDPVELQVRPVPPDFRGATWLPAKQLLLAENSPAVSEYRVGEPFTRVLTLQATGLSSSQLPKIGAPVPDSVKEYPDQPVLENRTTDDGMLGIRQEKIALIPSQAGTLTLPAIEIPWWNTTTGQIEFARLPAKTIEVLPATGATANSPAAQPAPAASAENDAAISAAAKPAVSVPGPAGATSIWQWLTIVFALAWLITLALWWWGRARNRGPGQPAAKQPGKQQLLDNLQRACTANDANAAKTALLEWAALQWPGGRIRSLGELAAQFDGDLQQQLHRLSQTLYSPDAGAWDGRSLWMAFSNHEQTPQAGIAAPQLEPLYRISTQDKSVGR